MSNFNQQSYPGEQQPVAQYPVAAAITPNPVDSGKHQQSYPGAQQPVAAAIIPNPVVSVMHEASCDGCRMSPIVGARYHCTVRNDFDLCSTCESKNPQPYPMTKVYGQEQPLPTYYKEHVFICDGCYMQPVIGPVFVCTVRDDFGFCSRCEGLQPQPYPMTKIYHHTQAIPCCDPARIAEIYSNIAMGAEGRREMFRSDRAGEPETREVLQRLEPPAPPAKPTRLTTVVIEQQPEQYQQRPAYYAPQRAQPGQPGQQQQQGGSVAHKLLNLHPKVQANALKVGGNVLKMFGNMAMNNNNNNDNN